MHRTVAPYGLAMGCRTIASGAPCRPSPRPLPVESGNKHYLPASLPAAVVRRWTAQRLRRAAPGPPQSPGHSSSKARLGGGKRWVMIVNSAPPQASITLNGRQLPYRNACTYMGQDTGYDTSYTHIRKQSRTVAGTGCKPVTAHSLQYSLRYCLQYQSGCGCCGWWQAPCKNISMNTRVPVGPQVSLP